MGDGRQKDEPVEMWKARINRKNDKEPQGIAAVDDTVQRAANESGQVCHVLSEPHAQLDERILGGTVPLPHVDIAVGHRLLHFLHVLVYVRPGRPQALQAPRHEAYE